MLNTIYQEKIERTLTFNLLFNAFGVVQPMLKNKLISLNYQLKKSPRKNKKGSVSEDHLGITSSLLKQSNSSLTIHSFLCLVKIILLKVYKAKCQF